MDKYFVGLSKQAHTRLQKKEVRTNHPLLLEPPFIESDFENDSMFCGIIYFLESKLCKKYMILHYH